MYVTSFLCDLPVDLWPFYQIFRIFNAHKEILFRFFVTIFFLLGHPFDEIILFEKLSMYFPVIPDNSHDLLRTSRVFYEIFFGRDISRFILYMLQIMPSRVLNKFVLVTYERNV